MGHHSLYSPCGIYMCFSMNGSLERKLHRLRCKWCPLELCRHSDGAGWDDGEPWKSHIFSLQDGDIVIERAWNSASDVQSSSPKSMWSQSLRVSCFFSLKGKCSTRSFLIFSSWKAFGSSDMEESGKPWKICELWWHGEHDYLGNTGMEDGWVWERPRRGKNHRKGLPVI